MWLTLLLLFVSCQSGEKPKEDLSLSVEQPIVPDSLVFDSTAFDLNSDTGRTYTEHKSRAALRRDHWAKEYRAASSDSAKDHVLKEAGREMERILLNGIFPFWYGTSWDFNGYTNTPGEGVIACGYFVSTTLKHIGFNLNRYKLAQQSAKNACYSLALDEKTLHYTPATWEDLVAELEKLPEGLYVVGLDYHVGYLLRRKERLFFIHSSYLGTADVMIEPIETSPAFGSSGYYVSPVTTNPSLVRKWLLTEEVAVLK